MTPTECDQLSTAVRVSRIFGAASNLDVIRHLYLRGPQRRQNIADSTGLSHGVVGQTLNKLKSLGVVEINDDQVHMPSRECVYHLDSERLSELLRAAGEYMLGSSAPFGK